MLIKYLNSFLLLFLLSSNSFGQNTVDLIESTIKVGGVNEEVFYFGFSEGDQLVFNFEEVDGKDLKEIEIVEYPSTSRFMDFKASKISNKVLSVPKTGIYVFRFVNNSLAKRVCQFKIQRIPSDEEEKVFNSTVYWQTQYDTTYTTVQEKYLVTRDTSIVEVVKQLSKVHSIGNMNGNTSTLNFTLPNNTVAWSYYIGVGQEGQEALMHASKELATKTHTAVAKMPGYGPLAALALGSFSYITQLQQGEDVDYYLVDNNNVHLFSNGQAFRYFKKGKVINTFAKMEPLPQGMYHFCLSNDNAITPINVQVNVTAIVVNEKWGVRPVEKMYVASKQVPYLR